jgi:hypothetical protein
MVITHDAHGSLISSKPIGLLYQVPCWWRRWFHARFTDMSSLGRQALECQELCPSGSYPCRRDSGGLIVHSLNRQGLTSGGAGRELTTRAPASIWWGWEGGMGQGECWV